MDRVVDRIGSGFAALFPKVSLSLLSWRLPMKCNEDSGRALEQRRFRAAMGRYPTGVAVVAAYRPDGGIAGLTVNSFSSVSLQPLLVSWNLGNRSRWLDVFSGCSRYCINVLASGQTELARAFARSGGPSAGTVAWEDTAHDVPVLSGVAAYFDCFNSACHPAGDHVIFVGAVRDFFCDSRRAPLLFHAGAYHDGRCLQEPALP